jgi:asparagine synthase (glutamine-hydrolysing)
MRPGFSLPVYYTDTGKGFYFSTSLKEILPFVQSNRQLNFDAVSDFLYYQYMIPNSTTLIQGIEKMVPGSYIEVDYWYGKYTVKRIPFDKNQSHYSRKDAKTKLLDSIRESVCNLIKQSTTNELALTLTSGWDTNLLLYYLTTEYNKRITAVTIKGGESCDETVNAARIINNYYTDVDHLSSVVKNHCIDMLPDLVWCYEGYLFEIGMFLRHELAKILSMSRIKEIFLGVGADQILFPETSVKGFLRRLRNLSNSAWLFRYSLQKTTREKDFVVLIDYNTKMHAIMLNTFGIQGFFPFINKKTSILSDALGIINYWRKRYYKEQVQELLGESITQFVSKSGAVVDSKMFFMRRKDLLVKILTSPFTQRFLTLSQIETIRKDPVKYRVIVIHLVYLFLFNEIFISGRFDKYFTEPEINVMLIDFMKDGKFIPHDL